MKAIILRFDPNRPRAGRRPPVARPTKAATRALDFYAPTTPVDLDALIVTLRTLQTRRPAAFNVIRHMAARMVLRCV